MNSVNIQRRNPVLLINWQIKRLAVHLAGTCKNNLCVRIETSTGVEQFEMNSTVLFHVEVRIEHGVKGAYVTGEIEYVVHPAHHIIDDGVVADVSNLHGYLVANVVDILKISALARHHGVDDNYFYIAEVHESAGQVATDEAKASGNKH